MCIIYMCVCKYLQYISAPLAPPTLSSSSTPPLPSPPFTPS